MLNIVSEVSTSKCSSCKCSSCIYLSAIFIPCCPCIFLKSYGTKNLENDCRCLSSVCLLTKNKKPVYNLQSLSTPAEVCFSTTHLTVCHERPPESVIIFHLPVFAQLWVRIRCSACVISPQTLRLLPSAEFSISRLLCGILTYFFSRFRSSLASCMAYLSLLVGPF